MQRFFEAVFCRFDDTAPNDDTAPSFLRSVKGKFVGIPCLAYGLEVITKEKSESIILSTIIKLVNVLENKHGIEHGQALDKVADMTELDRIFIKAVWDEHKDTLNTTTGLEDASPEKYNVYVFFNLITKDFFQVCIDEETYMEKTSFKIMDPRDVDDDIRMEGNYCYFKKNRSRSFTYPAIVLDYEKPKRIVDPDVYVLENVVLSDSKFRNKDYINIIKIKNRQELLLVSLCYLSNVDLISYHIADPFFKKDREEIRRTISMCSNSPEIKDMENYFDSNIKLILDNRRMSFQISGSGENLNSYRYLERHGKLLKSVQDMDKWYIKVVKQRKQISEKVHESQHPESVQLYSDAGPDFIRSVVEVFEILLEEVYHRHELSVTAGFIWEDSSNAESDQKKLREKGNKKKRAFFYAIVNLIKEIGFIYTDKDQDAYLLVSESIPKNAAELHNKIFKNNNVIKWFICNLLEAKMNKTNPWYTVAEKYPDLGSYLCKMDPVRDQAKHDAEDKERFKYKELEYIYNMAHDIIRITLVPEYNYGISNNLFEEDSEAAMERKALDELKKYDKLYNSNILKRKAALVCQYYISKDSQYIVVCENLIQALLYAFVQEHCKVFDHIENVFTKNRQEDYETIILLYVNYGYSGDELRSKPNTAKYKSWIDSPEKMTSNQLLYMLFAQLDKSEPKFLESLLETYPDIIKDIDFITTNRGHNNLTDFERLNQDYPGFHDKFLTSVNYACKLLK